MLTGEPSVDAVLASLADRDSDVLELTQRLVAAPSPNLPGDERAPADVLLNAGRDFGLPAFRVVSKEPHRPNLLLTIQGERAGTHLGLCGHIDTKPVGEAASLWNTDPFTGVVEGDRLYGLGSTDMKGAVAAMMMAATALQEHRDKLAGKVTFVFTADEEYGSGFGAHYLTSEGVLADLDKMILGEPSGIHTDWDALRIVSRGVVSFRVAFSGTQTHSSISDTLPTVSATEAMARVMVKFRKEFRPRFPDHPICSDGPTVNIGVKVVGGVGYGVIAGHAEFWTDVRTTPGMTQDVFEEDVMTALAACEDEFGGAEVDVAFEDGLGWLQPSEVSPDDSVVSACQVASKRILEKEMPLSYFHGASDAFAFHANGGIPTIAAFGPGMLPLAHGPNEWVSISSLGQAMRMYAIAAMEFTGTESEAS